MVTWRKLDGIYTASCRLVRRGEILSIKSLATHRTNRGPTRAHEMPGLRVLTYTCLIRLFTSGGLANGKLCIAHDIYRVDSC